MSTINEPVQEELQAPVEIRTQMHIPELDGVRALAIWMVLSDHLLHAWPTPDALLNRIPKLLLFVFQHGWLGVDLFFVLSGFLITGILLDSRNKPHYFRNFYARRFLRIFPLYYLVLFIMWWFYPGHDRYFVISLFFLSNFYHPFRAGQPHGPGGFWSLAVEEHFYLLWPLLVRFLTRSRLASLAILVVVGVPFLRLWGAHRGLDTVNEIYMFTWFRCDGLALGALLAMWVRTSYANRLRSLQLAGALVALSAIVTAVGLPFGILKTGSVFRYTQAQLVFAGFLLAAVALRGTVVTVPLRSWFARLSGDLSYCVYLIHVAVGDACQYWLQKAALPLSPTAVALLRTVMILGITFGLARLSQRWIEQPALKLKRYFEYGR